MPAPLARLRRRYVRVLLATYALWIGTFELVGRYAATLPTVDLTTSWDRAIPLVPSFVWPYELCYLFPFLSLAVLRDYRRFNVAILAVLLADAAAYVVYLAIPVAFPRPVLGDGLAEKVLALEYATDFSPGANNMPSMHVALSWIMGRAMIGQRTRALDALVATLVLAITASTMLVKQHLVLDVVTGVAWGLGGYALAERIYRRVTDAGATPEEGLDQLLTPRRWLSLVGR